jgi:hypothetical protein
MSYSAILLGRLLLTESKGRRVIDMSGVQWLNPLHLVLVAAHAQRAAADGVLFEVMSIREELAGYAARMRLGDILDRHGARHALPPVRERDRHDSLYELHQISTGEDVVSMAQLVFGLVEPVDAAAASALHTGIAELGANICEHSGVGTGFVAAQSMGLRDTLRFAAADTGVGMLATLRNKGAGDSRAAIGMALSGTSSTGLPGHGTGLPTTLEAVSDLGGKLDVASGNSATRATLTSRSHRLLQQPLRGTAVEGFVPMHVARHRAQPPRKG